MSGRVLLVLCLAAGLAAQRETIHTIDLNGRPVPGLAMSRVETPSGEQRATTVTSVNGRRVPLETVEDHVISSTPGARIVERTVTRYDLDGNPGPPEKIRIEETRNPDGSQTRRATTWRSDLNGNLQTAERSVTRSRTPQASQTVVERPGLDGAMQVVERSTRTERGNTAETVTFDRDPNGNFKTVRREVTTSSIEAGATVEDTTVYTPADGGLQPAARRVVRTVTSPGGLKLRDIEIYSKLGADVAAEPVLQRQVREEETAAPGGAVLRTTSVRAAQADDYRVVRETRIEPR
jgi:hypothetical protein